MDIKNIAQNPVNGRVADTGKNTQNATGREADDAKSAKESTDKVTLTNMSAQVKALEEKAMAAETDNSARIAELKEAIANGTYKIDAEKVASKLIQTEALFARS